MTISVHSRLSAGCYKFPDAILADVMMQGGRGLGIIMGRRVEEKGLPKLATGM
jgi:hypothetical protein